MSSTFRLITGPQAGSARDIRQARTLAVAVAAIFNIAFALTARWLTGEFPRAEINGDIRAISVAQVALTTIVVGFIAWVARSRLDRISKRPERVWSILAPIALAVSLVGPLGSGVDSASKVVLVGMHLVAGAVIIPALRPTVRR